MRNGKPNTRSDRLDWRHGVLVAVPLVLLTLMTALPPFDEPADFHQGAEQRILLGIPHFSDVVSNLPFLGVGFAGLLALRRGRCHIYLPGEKPVWTVFFIGLCFIALGSGYYHWEPSDATLVWDRVPMALTFVALLCTSLVDRIDARVGLGLLPVLVLLSWFSIGYWYWSTLGSDGDLRFYVLVQAVPAVLIPLLLWLFPGHYDRGPDYVVALALYGVAFATDLLDAEIYALTGWISGHSLKHVIAAGSAWWLLRMLLRRRLVRP